MLRKTDKYMAIAALCMLTMWACTGLEEPFVTGPKEQKTLIQPTVGIIGENPSTKVVTTDTPYGQSAQAFASGTSLYMVMKSEEDAVTPGAAKYSRTIGFAEDEVNATNTSVQFATGYERFYEDSYSRNSLVSLYSVCVPGYYLSGSDVSRTSGTADATTWSIDGSTSYANSWTTTASATNIAWPLRSAAVGSQDAAFVNSQDLCFSNNVSSAGDGRISFDGVSHRFTSARMVFYHALTKVTFKIKKGDGFGTGETIFKFTNTNENIVLKGFNTGGTFNIVNGEFTPATVSSSDISKLASGTPGTGFEYELTGLMLPGSDLNGADKDLQDKVYFTIDGNLYHLTKAQLKNALDGETLSDGTTAALNGTAMRPGVHYIFTLTVGKKKVDKLTAAVVDWETVTAEETTPSNARIVFTLLDKGTHVTGEANLDVFRSSNTSLTIDDDFVSYEWGTGYAPTATPTINKAKLNENATGTGVYTAEEADSPGSTWYWPDNKTFYHFRAVMPKTTVSWKVNEDGINGDYITLAGENISGDDTYGGVCWGAPFYNFANPTTDKLTYSLDTGFDNASGSSHQIFKAIGPTESTINMVIFHMMSDVKIVLTTTVGADRVDLTNANMTLSGIYSSGLVRMGNGKVETTGSSASVNNTVGLSNLVPWRHAFVPQSLSGVNLIITTTDNNQYIVAMDGVVASAVSNALIANPYTETSSGSGRYTVNRWYPNYKYTYTFRLTKTDISLISATLADWEDVVAGNDDVQIQ